MGHQLDHLAGREVLAGLLVVFLVEFADELLEDVAHAEVAQSGQFAAVGVELVFGGEVDAGVGEFFEHVEQHVLGGHVPYLRPQLELIDDLLHVGAEAVEVVHEVGLQELLAIGGRVVEALQRPGAGVVEDVAAGALEVTGFQFGKLHFLALEADLFGDGVLRGFKQHVEAAQHDHGQDDVAVLAADVDVAQAVIGDAPDEGDEAVVGLVVHGGESTAGAGRGGGAAG